MVRIDKRKRGILGKLPTKTSYAIIIKIPLIATNLINTDPKES